MHTKYKSLMAVLAAGVLAVGSSSTAFTASSSDATTRTESSARMKSSEEDVRFFCREGYDLTRDKRVPTTYVGNERGKMAVIRWVRNDFPKEYDPWTRCTHVSPRFQEAYENGSFKYITNGIMNGSPVICTAREKNENCDTLLFTLLPKDNALKTLSDLQAILGGSIAQGPISQNDKPQLYLQVDIDEFLRTAPVE